MKVLLYILLLVVVVLIAGYKVASYKLIETQESMYAEMQNSKGSESPRFFPDSLKMDDSSFWILINRSKSKFPDAYDKQIQFLTDTLASMPEERIVGFECTFVENVVKLWNYNIKSLYQIISGKYISTDDFIYFRCYLISLGKDEFDRAINSPELFATIVDPSMWAGEEMMHVADIAYQKRTNKIDEEGCPRCVCTEVSYDFGSYKMTGEYVSPHDFEDKYPRLTERY
ncbi:MAG TPA: DUF4240 domain-containing protein [Chryseolinea sp.]|nr:DUF4240 domain-containing protein [Chryseolinea sp.]